MVPMVAWDFLVRSDGVYPHIFDNSKPDGSVLLCASLLEDNYFSHINKMEERVYT